LRSRRPLARHVLEAVDEDRKQGLGRSRDLEVGEAAEDLPEHDGDFPPGKVRAETKVRSAAEADVLVGVAPEIEAEGVGEYRLITIPRAVKQHHLLPPANRLARSEERRVGKECKYRWAPEH